MTDPRIAQKLSANGVKQVSAGDDPDDMYEIDTDLVEIEHMTSKAVLFVDADDAEYWVPKAAITVDEPHVLVAPWIVDEIMDIVE